MKAIQVAPLLLALAGCEVAELAGRLAASYSRLAVAVAQTDSAPTGTLSVGRGLTVDLGARIDAYQGVTGFHYHEPQRLTAVADNGRRGDRDRPERDGARHVRSSRPGQRVPQRDTREPDAGSVRAPAGGGGFDRR